MIIQLICYLKRNFHYYNLSFDPFWFSLLLFTSTRTMQELVDDLNTNGFSNPLLFTSTRIMQELVVPERKIWEHKWNFLFIFYFFGFKNLQIQEKKEEEDMGFITWKLEEEGDSSSGKLIQWFCGELFLVLAYTYHGRKIVKPLTKVWVELTKQKKL